jgi:hypothetical protein
MQLSENGGGRVTEEKACDHAWVDMCEPARWWMECLRCGEKDRLPRIRSEGNPITDPAPEYRCDKHGAIPRTVAVRGQTGAVEERFCPYCAVEILEKHGQVLVNPCVPA